VRKKPKLKSKLKARNKNNKPLFICMVRILLLFLLLIGLLMGICALQNPHFFPIRKVRVEASFQHIAPQVLHNIVLPFTKKSFFALPIGKLRASLLKLPWSFEVNVRRTWPDKLLIQIGEQKIAANWNNNALININGEIFIPPQMPNIANLPLLLGRKDQVGLIWQRYLDANKFLQPMGLTVMQMALLPTQDMRISFSNGTIITLANDEFSNSINTFIKIYPKLTKSKPEQIESIDFRYSNGFAVKWKQ
jgi:cell division protein FtsQ